MRVRLGQRQARKLAGLAANGGKQRTFWIVRDTGPVEVRPLTADIWVRWQQVRFAPNVGSRDLAW
jgi:hypothetical protein